MNSYNGFTAAQRTRALRWYNVQVAAGHRARPTRCEACGQTAGLIEPHSEDYSEPFGANIGRFGLCYRCHLVLHCRFREPGAFTAYVEALARGIRWKALASRDFGQIQAMFVAVPGGRGLRLPERDGWEPRMADDGDPMLLIRMAQGAYRPAAA